MKIVTTVAATLVLAGAVAAPAAAQRNSDFASAVQRANAADPGFLEALEGPLEEIADQVLTGVSVDEITIDPRTGELVVRGTRDGVPVTLAGDDIRPDGPPPAVFGWLACAWNWFTSLGAEGCEDEEAQVAPVENPWDRAQEARHRAAYLRMTTGHGGG